MEQLPPLSDREWEVVDHLRQGKSNKQIAASLHISRHTVEFHLKNIYAKAQVSSRTELILKLGNTVGGPEREKLRDSVVVDHEEGAENTERPHSQANWATSLRVILSNIGKELQMNNVLDPHSHDGAEPMTFQDSIRVCLTKYADFSGQATRAEFWWFMLFVLLVAAALVYLSEALGSIFLIAMLLPLAAVGTRRLHDTGRSGWWLLFALVPVAGIVVLMVMWSMPGTAQPGADQAAG